MAFFIPSLGLVFGGRLLINLMRLDWIGDIFEYNKMIIPNKDWLKEESSERNSLKSCPYANSHTC
ncbi:hypothetical protein LMH81_28760, partial [Vibrio lentus]|nr:hypothetical protein [Vibrio lentus]